MKVVLAAKSVYPFHPIGGVQKYVYNFAKHLLRAGVELEVVAPLDSGKVRSEIYDGIKYIFLKPAIYSYLEYPIGWLGVHMFSSSLAKYLKTIKFDLLHGFDLTAYQYLKEKKRQPTIVHIFTDNYLSNPISFNNPLTMLNLTASRFDKIKEQKVRISPFADAATKRQYWIQYLMKIKPVHFCMSQSNRVFFEDEIFKNEVDALYKLDSRKSDVLPVGTDISYIEENLKDMNYSRQGFGLDEKDIVLITVNRLAADKGVDKILLALPKIAEEIPNIKLIIVGSGYQEKELYRIIESHGLKKFVRHFKNIPEKELYKFYKMSDIYVCAFSYPGSSISTLEAMVCGLPIITTAQPWLVPDQRNGNYLENNAPETLCKAIIDLIQQSDLKQKGSVSKEIVKTYSWTNIAQQALEKYKNLLV